MLIVSLGGTTRKGSTSETALRLALEAAHAKGAKTVSFVGADLDLPFYAPECPERSERARTLIECLSQCDGVIISTPAYHGSISGIVKNALDYVEDLRRDVRPYLDGRPIGCIVTGAGWQGVGSTLSALRATVHALRGWPTPLGVTINTTEVRFDPNGGCSDGKVALQLSLMAEQVAGQARLPGRALRARPLPGERKAIAATRSRPASANV